MSIITYKNTFIHLLCSSKTNQVSTYTNTKLLQSLHAKSIKVLVGSCDTIHPCMFCSISMLLSSVINTTKGNSCTMGFATPRITSRRQHRRLCHEKVKFFILFLCQHQTRNMDIQQQKVPFCLSIVQNSWRNIRQQINSPPPRFIWTLIELL